VATCAGLVTVGLLPTMFSRSLTLATGGSRSTTIERSSDWGQAKAPAPPLTPTRLRGLVAS